MRVKLGFTVFSFYTALFASLFALGLSVSTSSSIATTDGSPTEMPPSGFCQTKTDYDSNVSCSNQTVEASNMSELQSYQSNFGLFNNQYKNLKIGFALSGSNVTIHSPCDILLKKNLTHTATNLCLDGKKEVMVDSNSVLMSERVYILSMEGHSIIQNSTVVRANELEIFSSGKIHVNQGVRLDIRDNARLVSTYSGSSYTPIRFGPGSMVESNNLTIVGYGTINFNSMSVISRGAIFVESKGTSAHNKIRIVTRSNIRGRSVSMISGNIFEIRSRSFLRSEQNTHVQATGCLVQRNTTIEAATYSGSCLNASRVNQIPTVVIGATPLSGEIPLTVAFSAMGSFDPDGQIISYRWTFPDNSILVGSNVSYEFTEAGAYMVKLTLTDDDGAIAQKEILVTAIRPLLSPVASFTFTPERGEAPLRVSFDGSGSSDPDGQIETYEWIFSDGTTLFGPTQERVFDRAGEYRVSLRVTDDSGLTHQTRDFTIYVTEPNLPPVLIGDQIFGAMQNKAFQFILDGATDPEMDLLTYSIVNEVSSGTLSGCLGGTDQLTCTYMPAE